MLAGCLAALLGAAAPLVMRSDWATGAGTNVTQPIQFSHAHHVGGLGIDCRYCHTTVETSSFANIPPTKTCMNCHSQIWVTSPFLEPVRSSFRTGESLQWMRVHNLPDFVQFNHSHPREEGDRLRDLPRARGPDGGDVPGQQSCRWSGASIAIVIRRTSCGPVTR